MFFDPPLFLAALLRRHRKCCEMENYRNKYVRFLNIRTEITLTAFVACCTLLSHVEYGLKARFKDRTDGRTDTRPLHYA